jgi:hypothetical protein
MSEFKCRLPIAISTYGDRPSMGVCSVCEHYDGPPRGAGDVVHAIAKATGIAKVVEKVSGGDCGCARRRAALNAALPIADPEPENR